MINMDSWNKKRTRESILGLRVIIDEQITWNKITYLVFIGVEKAFDNINKLRNNVYNIT